MSEAAWVIRDYQRQRLVEKLMNKVYRREDEIGEQGLDVRSFRFNLVLAVVSYLGYEAIGGGNMATMLFFKDSVACDIEKFARSESETKALICKFLDKVILHATHEFHSALQAEEVNNPQQIYQAPAATTEVSEKLLEEILGEIEED